MLKKRANKEINIYGSFDRVGIEVPQLPRISKFVVAPMKVVFVNRCADNDANVIRLFATVDDFTDFCEKYWITLG